MKPGDILSMKKISCLLIFLVLSIIIPTKPYAQVSITLGAQNIYDDNIFLENTSRPPIPILSNQDLLEGTDGERPNPLILENFDGKPNSDFITNLNIGIAGELPFARQIIKSSYDFDIGALFFAEYSEQDRITLDGAIETSLSDLILPRPYYLSIRNGLFSASNNVAAPGSTATQTTQNYILTGETGFRKAEIASNTTYSLGYLGSYQKFLGDFLINSPTNPRSLTQQGGVDFHSHMGITSLDYRVNNDLEVGIAGSGGMQIFTDITAGDFGGGDFDPSLLDRTNAEIKGTAKYTISKTLFFDGAAGIGYSQLSNDPGPLEFTFINEEGQTVTELRDINRANTGLTYLLSLNYAYRPGSLLTVGGTQGFTTNIDGQRFITRVSFFNISEPLTDDIRLIIGGSYMQFEDQSDLAPNFDRFEGSVSFNYHIGQNTALMAGYNYTVQSTKTSDVFETNRLLSQDFHSNRIFFGITTGFVGLPL
jgi:hypothetical protein